MNRATLVKAPTSPVALLAMSRFAGHRSPSSFAECIMKSWRTCQTRIAAKVPKLECLVLCGPAAVLIGFFSFGRVLLQVVNPSTTGAQPRGVPNPSAHEACEAFSLTFGLSCTPCTCLSPLVFPGPFLLPLDAATSGGCPPLSASAMCPATDLPWKILRSIASNNLFLCSYPSKQS